MALREAIEAQMATEFRSEHTKIYIEPTLKKIIQAYAIQNHISFSEAGRRLWLNALDEALSTLEFAESIGKVSE